MTSPFDLDGATWQPVSRKLITVRTLITSVLLGVLLAIGVTLAVALTPWLWIIPGVFALIIVWALWLIRRQVPAIGYAELDDDLGLRRGIMFRSLILIPYGRMQYVQVDSGPIARKFGLATVTLHTAATSTAEIPGLPVKEAARLRDRLTTRAESKLAGL